MTVSAPRPAVIALVFVFALTLSLAACGGDDSPDQQAEDATATQTTSAEESAGDEQADEAARHPGRP
jgi:Flp pilus assembly protein TadD